MEYSPPGSSVHGISQARILEWVAISFSIGSSQPRNLAHICDSCIGRRILYYCVTWEALSTDTSLLMPGLSRNRSPGFHSHHAFWLLLKPLFRWQLFPSRNTTISPSETSITLPVSLSVPSIHFTSKIVTVWTSLSCISCCYWKFFKLVIFYQLTSFLP